MKFYSRGKLLLSGEYLVLKGSTALAVPLKIGQDITIKPDDFPSELTWVSKDAGEIWFKTKLKLPLFDIIETSDVPIARRLIDHLKAAVELQPDFIDKLSGKQITTNLEFNRDWGLGSSSTLISNIAYWADIDPYLLHKKVSSGSGYDVICARENGPMYYWLEGNSYQIEKTNLPDEISKNIFFVYMGNKKKSEEGVKNFLSQKKKFQSEKNLISDLSRHMGNANSVDDFAYYMKEHEQILSSLLKTPTLKETVFKDFAGESKSLGAWGGDFAMLVWNGSKNDLEQYLQAKKLNVLFAYNEIVIKGDS